MRLVSATFLWALAAMAGCSEDEPSGAAPGDAGMAAPDGGGRTPNTGGTAPDAVGVRLASTLRSIREPRDWYLARRR